MKTTLQSANRHVPVHKYVSVNLDKMFLKHVSFGCLLYAQLCWSYLILQNAVKQTRPQISSDADVGEPLILTPYLKSNQVAYARQLSNVEPFFENIVSNAGFFTVDEVYNSNLFFWFFRKEGIDWLGAPLILWLQGGPGGSSLYGLFQENGPFVVVDDKLQRRIYSWTKLYNVIYIDQPVGTGFSFTNSSKGRIKNQQQVGDHLYKALTQFYQLYPELKDNELFISGESYAGRYVPAIAYKIHTLKAAGKSNINLKGLFMVSATIDGGALTTNLGEFCYQIGIVDSRTKYELNRIASDRESYIRSSLWKKASQLRDTALDIVLNQSEVNFYDFTKSPSALEDDFVKFLQSSDTRRKIHVGRATYSEISDAVYYDFEEDISKTVVPWVEELLEHYRIAFVGGQFDVSVAYPLVISVLKGLTWSGAHEYSLANRSKVLDGTRVAGYSKRAGNLKEVLVRSAGHMVPEDQPRVALNLLIRFVNNLM